VRCSNGGGGSSGIVVAATDDGNAAPCSARGDDDDDDDVAEVAVCAGSLLCPTARPLRHCDPGFSTQPPAGSQAQLAVKLILSRVRH